MAKVTSGAKKSGRHIAIVYPAYGGTGVMWGTRADRAPDGVRMSARYTQAKAVAVAQDWIAKQPDPASYELIVVA